MVRESKLNLNWVVAVVSPRDIAVHPNFREDSYSAPRALASWMRGWNFALQRDDESSLIAANEEELRLLVASRQAFEAVGASGARDVLLNLAQTSHDMALATVSCVFYAASLADADDYAPLLSALDDAMGRLDKVDGAAGRLLRSLVYLQRVLRKGEIKATAREDAESALEEIRRIDPAELQPLDVISPGVAWDSLHVWQRVMSTLEGIAFSHVANTDPLGADNQWMELVRRENPPVQMEFLASTTDGLEEYVEGEFNRLTKDPTITWGGGDRIDSPVLAELLHEELIGSRAARGTRKLLGQLRLLQTDVHGPTDALRLLRQSEDRKAFRKAGRYIRAHGPLESVRDEALAVIRKRPVAWWRDVELEALALGGDLVSRADAATAYEALVGTVKVGHNDSSARFSMEPKMLALVALSRSAGLHDDLASRIRVLVGESPQDQLLMNAYASGLSGIDWQYVHERTKDAWRDWIASVSSNVEISSVRLVVSAGIGVAGHSTGDSLLDIAAQLNSEVRFPGSLNENRAAQMRETLIAAMESTRRNAAKGSFSFGGVSAASLATILAFGRADARLWNAIVGFLTDASVAQEMKTEALDRLAASASDIPDDAIEGFREGVDGLFGTQTLGMGGDATVPFAAAYRMAAATGVIEGVELLSEVSKVTSDPAPRVRVEAAKTLDAVAGRPKVIEPWVYVLLVQLCRDRDATVRAFAGHALARAQVSESGLKPLWEELMLELLAEDSILVPLLTVRGLSESWKREIAPSEEVVQAVVRLGKKSLSGVVREACKGALEDRAAGKGMRERGKD